MIINDDDDSSDDIQLSDTLFNNGLASETISILEILNHRVIHSHKTQAAPVLFAKMKTTVLL